ncbi:MAG: bifunctional phosphopantothenoylcysteine decarboxylase/phosphopantothenate--cysteine ligase CoaBC [Methanomassiliicoccales archaeon]|nr:bifunctional phosphopantothenoylcysteine decarboxylase/phosphopantothenate--cysteine ligase CoaBC [Methanomassiliicoccales archaeon]
MHPSESVKCTKSTILSGKRIILGITGSIAAVESLELARELIRHGAEVHAVMTPEALRIITHHTMEFATGNPVITEIDGKVQHVSLLGDFPDKADMLLIAPCTANTISKIAVGIDDTPVTTMATTAMGSKVPIMIAPAMHSSMFMHPVIQRNVETLKDLGVDFVGPHMDGKKARLANTSEIVAYVIKRVGKRDLQGKSVLIIGGSSEEPIDDMRIVTNRGTGETAVQLALAAFERGADVDLWMGRSLVPLPSFIPTRRFTTVGDLIEMIKDVDHDIVIVPAALSDFAPERTTGKISSERNRVVLSLTRCPKILESLRDMKRILVGFKAESGVGSKGLEKRAIVRLKSVGLDMIVANDLKDVSLNETKVTIVSMTAKKVVAGTKRYVADCILDEVTRIAR